eukprot:4117378-Lingulodinium_polyedra.AAC.1
MGLRRGGCCATGTSQGPQDQAANPQGDPALQPGEGAQSGGCFSVAGGGPLSSIRRVGQRM